MCPSKCTQSITILQKMLTELYLNMREYLPDETNLKEVKSSTIGVPVHLHCLHCYQSITALEHLVNMLYCYMGEYLPE